MAEQETQEQKSVAPEGPLEEMVRAGVHFGHKTSKTHPKMKQYIAGVRNTTHIIDLEKTQKKLQEALGVIKKMTEEHKTILFVGTKIQVKDQIKAIAEATNSPYVIERWIGGTLTNFGTISKRVEELKELERQKEEGEWQDKYTKKEQLDLQKRIDRLNKKFGGLKVMTKLPDAVFVADADKNATAIHEAQRKGLPLIGIIDTNIDPTIVNYPIPANDDAISSVRYIMQKVGEAIRS